jgi:alanyl-tRNA synthetase
LKDTAYRVVADHVRTLTFALTDGAQIGNEGRNYVLKRILRRAERYGRQYLGTKEPFLCHLVPAVVEAMGHVFPELKRNPQAVADAIRQDEVSFVRTLDRGIGLFQEAAERAKQGGGKQIGGEDAFKLHDTHGVYIDITEQMAQEAGLTVNREGFERELEAAKQRSREGGGAAGVSAITGELPKTDDSPKYDKLTTKAKVVGWVKDNAVVTSGQLGAGEEVSLLLDRTNFYAEQGGQVGDAGTVTTKTGKFAVEDTKRLGDAVLHVGKVVEGTIKPGQPATLEVSGDRPHTMRNHTATHLMNWALRKVLGDHIEQKGSLVDAGRTRFDFSHPKAMTPDEVAEVERLVNEKIYSDLPVTDSTMPLEEAKKLPGVRAVFGEKYPDPVRVLMIGPKKPQDATAEHSVEFCGGTHLSRTGEAGFFKIVSQEKIGAGIQRVTAVTGKEAVATVQRMSTVLDDLTGRLNCKPEEIGQRITALQEQVKKLEQQLKKGASADLNSVGDKLLSQAVEVNGAKVIVGEVPAAPAEQMRSQVDRLRQRAGSSVIVLGWTDEDKVMLLAGVTEDLTKKVRAGDLVKAAAAVVGGKGGGRPDMAQGGGSDPSKLPDALRTALDAAKQGLT